MAGRLLRITRHLQLIESELRGQGWWDEEAPSAAALASVQPFCVDTLAFEQWLQWIFLPRMQQLLATGAALPGACAIRPMAEQVYAQRAGQARELIRLLGEIDELIAGAN